MTMQAPTKQDNAALAQQIYTAFNRGDLEACAALAAEDMETVMVPFNMTLHGPDGFRQFMHGFHDAFPDLNIHIISQVVTEDAVINECEWTGTHTGPLITPTGEIPPTNKAVTHGQFCEVWRVRNGKLVSLHNYQDTASWLRQLGLAS